MKENQTKKGKFIMIKTTLNKVNTFMSESLYNKIIVMLTSIALVLLLIIGVTELLDLYFYWRLENMTLNERLNAWK